MNDSPKSVSPGKIIGCFAALICLGAIIIFIFSFIAGKKSIFSPTSNQDTSVVTWLQVVEDTQAILKANPDDIAARLTMAEATFYLGGIPEAKMEMRSIRESGKLTPGFTKLEEYIQFYEKTWDEAAQLYAKSLVNADPSSFFPQILKLCNTVLGNYDGVLAQRAHFLKAHVLLREGRKDEAFRELDPIVGKYLSLNDYCQYYLARSLATEAGLRTALREFDRLLDLYPDSRIAPLALLEQFNILNDTGYPEKAVEKAEFLIAKYPESTFVPVARRKLADLVEQDDPARAMLERYLIIDEWPDSVETGKVIASIRDVDPQLKNFLTYEKIRILEIMTDKGMYDSARPLLNDIVTDRSANATDRAGAYYLLGRIEFYGGKYSNSISKCQESLRVDPNSPWTGKAQNRIGHSHKRRGNLSNALTSYATVADNYPDLAPYSLYNSGVIHASRGEITSAIRVFSRLADEYPDSTETESALKQLYILSYRRNEFEKCIEFADRSIELFPDGKLSSTAHFWRAKALSRLGKALKATQELTYMTMRYQRTYYGIRASELLGANPQKIHEIVFRSGADDGGGIKGGPGPARLDQARELMRANIFDLAVDEFDVIPKGITPEADFTRVKLAYLSGDWHMAYKTTREFFFRGYGNLLNGVQLEEMLLMGYPRGFQEEIGKAASNNNLDISWMNGFIIQESTFQERIVSHADAIGLCQVMPSTGEYIAHLKGLRSFDTSLLYNADTNTEYGAFYFDYLRDMFDGDLTMTLVAYNGGPGNARTWRERHYKGDVDIFIESIPAIETLDFVKYVYANIIIYQAIEARETD